MGVHRATRGWWPTSRHHVIWIASALAVLTVTAAVSFASHQGDPHGSATTGLPVADDPGVTALATGSEAATDVWSSAGGTAVPSSSAATTTPPATPPARPRAPVGPSGQPQPPPAPTPVSPPYLATPLVADYRVSSAWTEGYVATVTIRNAGQAPVTWRLEIGLPPGVTVAQTWNANFVVAGSTMSATPANSPTLAPGASIILGYEVRRTNPSNDPTYCAVNDSTCL